MNQLHCTLARVVAFLGASALITLGAAGMAHAQTSPAATPTVPAPAVAPTSARYLAANCANCHGTNGQAQGGGFNLAGLPKAYIVEQMQAFKTGKRQATIMHQLSKGYSDAQIEQMAEYFAAQKPL
jgi:cytochrome subunit of sulfide dehydrogenase